MRLDCTVGAQRSALSAGWRRPSVHTDTFIHPRPLSTRARSAAIRQRSAPPLPAAARTRPDRAHFTPISRAFHEHFTPVPALAALHPPLATTGNPTRSAIRRGLGLGSRRIPSRPLSLASPLPLRASPTFSTSLNLAHLAHLAPSPRRARTCTWTLALDPGPQRSAGSGSGSNARSDSLDSLGPSSPTPAPPAPPAHLLQLTYCLVLLETPGLPSEPHDDCLLCKVSLAVDRCRSP